MKNKTMKASSIVALSAFVFAPGASHAQISTTLAADVKADLDTAIEAAMERDMMVDTAIGTDVKMDSDLEVDSDMSSTTATTTDVDADFEADSKKETTIDAESDMMPLKVNNAGIVVVSSAQVNSEEDLEVFTANTAATKTGVERVKIESETDGESKVRVVYRHKGKLFGLIPTTVKSTTTVEGKVNGETEVHSNLSWWSFLVTQKNYAQADIESRIKNNTTVQANAKANVSAQAKAQVVEAVIAEVAAHADAQASINN